VLAEFPLPDPRLALSAFFRGFLSSCLIANFCLDAQKFPVLRSKAFSLSFARLMKQRTHPAPLQ